MKRRFNLLFLKSFELEIVKTATGMLEENMYTTNTFTIMETKFFYKVTLPILILLLICVCSCTTAAKPDTNFELCHKY